MIRCVEFHISVFRSVLRNHIASHDGPFALTAAPDRSPLSLCECYRILHGALLCLFVRPTMSTATANKNNVTQRLLGSGCGAITLCRKRCGAVTDMRSMDILYQHTIVHTNQRIIGLPRCKHGSEGRSLASEAVANTQEERGVGRTTRFPA